MAGGSNPPLGIMYINYTVDDSITDDVVKIYVYTQLGDFKYRHWCVYTQLDANLMTVPPNIDVNFRMNSDTLVHLKEKHGNISWLKPL